MSIFLGITKFNENDSNNRIEVLDENGMTCEDEITDFEPFPSDADMQHASDAQVDYSNNNEEEENDDDGDDNHMDTNYEENSEVLDYNSNNEIVIKPFELIRQTFLYSATAIQSTNNKSSISRELLKKSKKWKLAGTLLGISSDSCLPLHIKQ